MTTSIKQLLTFDAVVQTKSFTRAAKKMKMTQPAVSQHIKQLEELSPSTLFERKGREYLLTTVGVVFYQHVQQILLNYNNLISCMDDMGAVHRGSIVISAATTTNHFMAAMLASFLRNNKGITFSLDITNRAVLVKQLADYAPDFVVMGEPPEKLNLFSEVIMQNPLVLIANTEHPFANKKNIKLKQIVNEVFAVREKGSGTRAAIAKHFKQQGHQFTETYEMGSNEAIKNAVVAGLGLGVVSLHTIQLELEANKLVILDVETLPIMRDWHIVMSKGKRLSPAAKAFRQHILQQALPYTESYKPYFP
ncbi:MAG: LysR family transcriptional regulator [Cocleimonas sp.]|nr:LysR family transcriptional regulator [Cocleimonas sp.]